MDELRIRIESLRIGGKDLIKDLNIDLEPGSRLGITGPSGCGKTTLLRALVRGELPTGSSGTIRTSFKRIGYCPQGNGLLPWYSLAKNLQELAFRKGRNGSAKHAISACEIEEVLVNFPDQLSGGEAQRANLACSIVQEPAFYIADEPLTEVDLKQRWRILRGWSGHIAKAAASLMMVSHDIDTLTYLCDNVLILGGFPATAISIIAVSGEHPRSIEDVQGFEFQEVRSSITKAIVGGNGLSP